MANTNTVAAFPGVLEVAGMVISPNGGQVSYVGTAAQQAALGQTGEAIASRSFTTINAALSECVTGRGDYIYVLPGYTENIAAADGWSGLGTKTDVTICGLGHGTNRPAITWTVAGSTMLMDSANFRVLNCQLFLAGPHAAGTAVTVAAPITITAAGCEISDCDIYWGFDADQIVTIGITTTATADYLKFNRNRCYAETAAVPTTTFLRLTGTDFLEIDSTQIIGPGSTVAIGPVQQLTTGALKVKIFNSLFQNTLASSTHCFTAIAGSTGLMALCHMGVLAAGNGITTGSGIQVTGTWVAVAGAASALATG
jgi:hypothetical protein